MNIIIISKFTKVARCKASTQNLALFRFNNIELLQIENNSIYNNVKRIAELSQQLKAYVAQLW